MVVSQHEKKILREKSMPIRKGMEFARVHKEILDSHFTKGIRGVTKR